MADDSPALPQASLLPKVTVVDKVEVQDDQLIWTGTTTESQVGTGSVLFAIQPANKDRGVILCCLRELPIESERPFELVLLESQNVPDQIRQHNLLNDIPSYLRQDEGNQVDFIVSTNSGTGLALGFWQHVLQPLWKLVREELGTPAPSGATATATETHDDVLITQSAESVSQFARGMWSSRKELPREAAKTRTVVFLSGDGGVVDLLNARDDGTPTAPLPLIALLPLGTGNALFHSLQKPAYSSSGPSPLVLGLRTLFQGTPADLPVFRASFSPGSHIVAPGGVVGRPVSHLDGAIVASYGFHASVVYESDTPAYRVHGSKRFVMVAQELLRESHLYTAQVEFRRPGSSAMEVIPRGGHAYVLTSLVSNLERTFTISPASTPFDGQLRVVHFGDIGGERAMAAMMKAYDGGKHVGTEWDDGEKIYYDAVDEIRVVVQEEDGRWRKVCVDGTIVDVPKDGNMSVTRLGQSPLRILANPSVLQG